MCWVAVVSASFPCLVGCRFHVISLPCYVVVVYAWYFASVGGLSRIIVLLLPWERVVIASRQYFSYRSSYVGSSQVFCRVAVVSALFPYLVGYRLRVVSLPCYGCERCMLN